MSLFDKYIIYETRNVFNGMLKNATIICDIKMTINSELENAQVFMATPKATMMVISITKHANPTLMTLTFISFFLKSFETKI